MDLEKLTTEEIRGMDSARLNEAEKDIRRELAMLRMDVYSAQGQSTAKAGKLKKGLARILTVKNQTPAKLGGQVN